MVSGLLAWPVEPVEACLEFPTTQGVLVRAYEVPNGMFVQEYDLDGDGKADYGTARTPLPGFEFYSPWPLFYARGYEDPTFFHDATHPFVASLIWVDKGNKGRCEDIRVYYVRGRDRTPFGFEYHSLPEGEAGR